jgi:hypothetical protein
VERYLCKECGAPAKASEAGIRRTCSHAGTVLLDMTVTCRGEGGMQDQSRLGKLVDAIIGILSRVRGS